MNYNELYHHGILGMKWGKRNGPPYPLHESDKSAAEKKKISRTEKKHVDYLYKRLAEKGSGLPVARGATAARIDKSLYREFAEAVTSGEYYLRGRFEKNYKEKSVDYYVGNDKEPTVRARYKDKKDYVYDFIDKTSDIRYNEFVDYFENEYLKEKNTTK